VIGRRSDERINYENNLGFRLDLTGANLQCANLIGGKFTRAYSIGQILKVLPVIAGISNRHHLGMRIFRGLRFFEPISMMYSSIYAAGMGKF